MKMKKNNVPKLVGDVLKDIGETPDTAGWDCHGTFVLLHKALERVAAHKKITFDAPTIVESDINSKNVVIIVTGHLGDKSEWSFGEAAPYNNKNAYPFAMAEKRAKDRVILKLVGLHGYAYSEEEADDFKKARPVSINDTPTANDDVINDDVINDDVINDMQLKSLADLIQKTSTDVKEFCKHFNINATNQLSVMQLDTAMSILNSKLAA
jgi:hypothetical protein